MKVVAVAVAGILLSAASSEAQLDLSGGAVIGTFTAEFQGISPIVTSWQIMAP